MTATRTEFVFDAAEPPRGGRLLGRGLQYEHEEIEAFIATLVVAAARPVESSSE